MRNFALSTQADHPDRAANPDPSPKEPVSEETQVVAPEAVDVPLPKEPGEEIAIPASINGRDLSKGKP